MPMPLEIKRLHLASLRGIDGREWPVRGFVVTDPGGAVLVDTGCGGPDEVLNDWRVVNRSVADALAGLGMTPADIGLVINTHLHFDHCGQNAVFKHAACYVQRTELDRAKRESPDLYDWFGFMNARFELLDGDAEVLPGLSVITTPGHTGGAGRRARRPGTAGRPGQGPGNLGGLASAGPVRRRAGAFLPPHGRRARLGRGSRGRSRGWAAGRARPRAGRGRAGRRSL